jgi:glutamate dehydrogenase
LISEGGGVFSRSSKSISLSPEVQVALDIDAQTLTPNQLIQALLRAPVDLLWNGGIGTYVKNQRERHIDVGDRANDGLRINGQNLRCQVVVEGGNLGFTQLGRVEYALKPGVIQTDAIDNSAGVDCSDHEVNIKILLDTIVCNGDMTIKQRNQLLTEMTADVAKSVLRDNYLQTQAIYLALSISPQMLDIQTRFIQHLERIGKLDRVLENLPSDRMLQKRHTAKQGLTSPEISVLLAYSKISLYEELLASDLPDDPYLKRELESYFPDILSEKYPNYIEQHRLRREIIVTSATNSVVNYMGDTFVFSLNEETNLPASDIVRACTVAWHVFDIQHLWTDIEHLDNKVYAEVQYKMMLEIRKLVERASRWFLRNSRSPLNIEKMLATFRPGVSQLSESLSSLITESERKTVEKTAHEWLQFGVPSDLANSIASLVMRLSALDIVESVKETSADLKVTAALHFKLGTALNIHWMSDKISNLPRHSRWNALARSALRDELHKTHRALTTAIVKKSENAIQDPEKMLSFWMKENQAAIDRWLHVYTDLSTLSKLDLSMLSVALRKIQRLL